jgi:hypothetical protein
MVSMATRIATNVVPQMMQIEAKAMNAGTRDAGRVAAAGGTSGCGRLATEAGGSAVSGMGFWFGNTVAI